MWELFRYLLTSISNIKYTQVETSGGRKHTNEAYIEILLQLLQFYWNILQSHSTCHEMEIRLTIQCPWCCLCGWGSSLPTFFHVDHPFTRAVCFTYMPIQWLCSLPTSSLEWMYNLSLPPIQQQNSFVIH